MKMRLCVGIFLLAAVALRAQTNDLTALLQQGLFEEQANRNLDAAIASYQSLVVQFDKNRQLAATAVFRLGECYRAQGRTNEAAPQYRRILRDFSDQQTLATLSRQDLAGMGMAASAAAKTAAGSEPASSLPAAVGDLAMQISGIERLKSDPEEQARAVLAIFPDEELKQMLLHLPILQEQEAKLKANPRLTYAEVGSLGAPGLQFATGPGGAVDLTGLVQSAGHMTNLLADAQRELKQQIAWIQERVDFIMGNQKARLRVLEAANGVEDASAARHQTALAVEDEEDQEIVRIQQMIQNSPDLINAPSGGGSTPLVEAASSGWLRVAAYLLDHSADVNLPCRALQGSLAAFSDSTGAHVTPLVAAVAAGNKAMTQFLIGRGANVNFEGPNGNTPLHIAALMKFQAVTEVLLASHADVNAQNNSGASPLIAAVRSGQLKIVQMILAAGAKANLKDNKGRTALNYAIGTSPEIVQALLDAGTNPNTEDSDGRTLLSYAVERDTPQVVKLLLAAKADPNGGSVDAPLLATIEKADVAAAELLFRAGANPNIKGEVTWSVVIAGARYAEDQQKSLTPLYFAVTEGRLALVQLFLKYKADPDDSQTDGKPLIFSALSDTNILEALLNAGANIEAHDQNVSINGDRPDWTPLAAAAWAQNAGAAEILLRHGANPNIQDAVGNTPLHWVISFLHGDLTEQSRESTQLLLEHGANPNVRNASGDTPLDWAKRRLQAESNRSSNRFPPPNRGPGFRATNPEPASDQKAEVEQIIALLHRHGALDSLPDWNRIMFSRPANHYSAKVFERDTNDWNHFTLLELVFWIYHSSALDNSWSSFPDLTRIVVVRPSTNGAAAKRIAVNLLKDTNSVDCARDVPLEFGDVVEVPEREHSLAEGTSYLTHDQEMTILNYFRSRAGEAKLIVAGGQTVQLPLQPFFSKIGQVLSGNTARAALTSNSDLSRVKVTRHNPQTAKTESWILDCSNRYNPPDLWLRAGDLIEVPDKL